MSATQLQCVEFATGKEKWISRSPGKGKLIIADGQMILITEYGALVLAMPSPDGYMEPPMPVSSKAPVTQLPRWPIASSTCAAVRK